MVNLISLLEKTNQELETLTIHDHRCLHQISSKSQCARCVDHCPAGALQIHDGKLQADDCFLCGQCVKHCPVNVFEWKSPSYEQVLKRCEESKAKEENLILSCSGAPLQLPEAAVLHLPSFAYLLDEIWTYLKEQHHLYYYLPEGSCEKCNKHCRLPASQASKRLQREQEVAEMMGGKESYDRQKRQSITGMFRFLRHTGMHSINLTPKVRTTGDMKKLWQEQVKESNQSITAEILPNCKDCKACGMLCPESAIRSVETEGDQPGTIIDTSKCSGCGLCVDLCYFKAVQLT